MQTIVDKLKWSLLRRWLLRGSLALATGAVSAWPLALMLPSQAQSLPTFKDYQLDWGLSAGEIGADDLPVDDSGYARLNPATAFLDDTLQAIDDDYVVGPASATDNALTLADGTSGKQVKASSVWQELSSILTAVAGGIDATLSSASPTIAAENSSTGHAIHAIADDGQGIRAESTDNVGVVGISINGHGVGGFTTSVTNNIYGGDFNRTKIGDWGDLLEQSGPPASAPTNSVRLWAGNDQQVYSIDDGGGIEPLSAGATDLDDLADVDTTGTAAGEVLTRNPGDTEWISSPIPTPTDDNTWAFSLPVGMENNTSDWHWDNVARVTGLTNAAVTYTSEITFTFDQTATPASATTGETFGRWRWTSQDLATDVQTQVGISRAVYRAGDDLTITFRVKVSLTTRLEAVWARISDGTNSAVSANQIGSMSNATWHEFSISQDVSTWGEELRIVLTAQGTRTGGNMGLTLFDYQSCLLEWN